MTVPDEDDELAGPDCSMSLGGMQAVAPIENPTAPPQAKCKPKPTKAAPRVLASTSLSPPPPTPADIAANSAADTSCVRQPNALPGGRKRPKHPERAAIWDEEMAAHMEGKLRKIEAKKDVTPNSDTASPNVKKPPTVNMYHKFVKTAMQSEDVKLLPSEQRMKKCAELWRDHKKVLG